MAPVARTILAQATNPAVQAPTVRVMKRTRVEQQLGSA
ncbi:hypothetical protein F441_05659 [Phytophthora nicotianae CJ01A1]|uniref:Uncharacterized protein n=4 Tax=Phytophthora nicotianae TaxID=4792 RepID=W2ZMJ8_PHYNI|nr:hypothetical protein L915_05512 [Phytophthora nicotianae]ETL44218.1 hypothetical protein L916_05455 [Phytophthora nicotianae]ETO79629.1 hypothetical protein F444_05701 [Phytophthora nicotianae P1976]ETP20686.1 hypothetical protein F441_05659 [Phytophthora nicotianae CJ01A1]ETP48622.1 hypothetical protein F442_05693 [Phytophthora nicotianae P10297]